MSGVYIYIYALAPNWTKKRGCKYKYNFGAGQKKRYTYMHNFRPGQETVGASAPTAPISSAPLIMLVTENIEFYEKLVVQFLALFARF